MSPKRFNLLLALLLCVFCLRAAPPPELPLEDFFGSPAISRLQFSPNGRFLAALVPVERRLNLVVMDLEKKDKKLITAFKDFSVSSYEWVNDDRLVMLLDDDGDEDFVAYAIDRDGKNFDRLDAARSIVRRDPANPRRVLVYAAVTHRGYPDPCWLDVHTGKLTVIAKNPGHVRSWVIDRNFQVRFGVSGESLDQALLYREKNGDEWKEIAQLKDGAPSWRPLAFDGDNRTVFVASSHGRSTSAIYRMDVASMTLGEIVCEDPVYDVDGVVWSQSAKRIVGIRYSADKERSHWLDEDFAKRQQILDSSLPGMINVQREVSDDGSKILVYSYADREPGVYYLFNQAQKKIEELAVVRPKIDPAAMAKMTPVTYQARDGLTIHAYLTLPVGREAKNLPFIVNPHGGPFGIRDEWRFSPEVQFLANRGFAVLQPNYRGSGGYGTEFERKGYRQWGRAMQDDLTDGVKWAIAQGIADPKKVVILGASYGGYAVMAGLAFTPELYCAGVNYVGVTDLKLIALAGRDFRGARDWRQSRLGDLYKDADELHARSPVNFAQNIRVPVLMAYGRRDPRVTREHGDDMKAALEKHQKSFEFIMESEEGHGFRKEEKSIDYYRRVEAFLKKHVLTP